MKTDNNQNTDNQLDNYIDTIQEILGTGFSLIVPKPVGEIIDTVTMLIDIRQEQNSSSEIPTWKITIANLAGAGASAPIFAVGAETSIEAALATLPFGGLIGLAGSTAIFYNGLVMTTQLTNETYRLSHDEMLNLLTSPGFIETEEAVTGKITDFRDSVIDFLGKTTGWSEQPSAANRLLSNISEELMNQATNISDLFKHAFETQLNQSLTFQAFSTMFEAMLLGMNRGQQAIPQRSDPLTLDLDGDGVEMVPLDQSGAFFDLDNDGFRERVGWVSADDGILVLDANHNGKVDNVRELFGYKDESGNGVEGTEELRQYDLNQDGVINREDVVFSELKVWRDLNGDGVTDEGELSLLANHHIAAINLDDAVVVDQNIAGNVIISAGSYVSDDGGSHQLANLDLAIDQTNSASFTYQDEEGNQVNDYDLDLEAVLLPMSRGYGEVKPWHIACNLNVDFC